ncbi:MAG TPA: peptidase T [Anaerolineales bacterium]|nr:peptidase T [Anaerolineales bacterium]
MPETVLDRFLRYVKVHTTSDSDSRTIPSTERQWTLLRMLADELRALGASEVKITKHGYVLATIPATIKKRVPTVALFAHVDTVSGFSGEGVKPIIHRKWMGKPIVLPDDKTQIIDPAKYTDMQNHVGLDLVTASGTTLLGADDKTGVAVIMTLADHLLRIPRIEHGPIRICFNPDEEIGRGVDKLDLDELGADAAYTLDGENPGEVNWETFSGDSAEVAIEGVSTHPGEGRKYKMVSALMLAARLLAALPVENQSAETTDGRDGYIHAIQMTGNTAQAEVRFILRDHDNDKLKTKGDQLRGLVKGLQAAEPRAKFNIKITPSYRNMGYWLRENMLPVDLADEAMRALGLTPSHPPTRGGTDGSRLTERGLPTPNLFAGAHNSHGPHEYAVVQEMELSVKMLIELVKLWAKKGANYKNPKPKNRK